MPVEVKLSDGISIFTCTGAFTASELIEAIVGWYPDHPTPLTLYDARDATLSELNVADFEPVTTQGVQFTPLRGPEAKTALVLRDNLVDELLAKSYNAFRKTKSPIPQRRFTDYEEAIRWLKQPIDQN